MDQRRSADGSTLAAGIVRRSSLAARAAGALLVLAAPGLAAGLDEPPPRPAPGPAPSPAQTVVDWSGPYGGLSLGVARSDGRAERAGFAGDLIALDVSNGLFPDDIDDADTGALGGLGFGVSRQRGAFVGGVELDVSALDQDVAAGFSRVDPNPDPIFFGVNTITGYETDIKALATLRLRAGYATGASLLYATAGLAAGDVRNAFTLEIPELGYASPDDWSEDGIRHGYTVGVGIERRVRPRVSVRAEALYYDLEDVTIEATDPVTFPGQGLDYEFANDGVIARLGVSVAF